jgi:hypothetical protein
MEPLGGMSDVALGISNAGALRTHVALPTTLGVFVSGSRAIVPTITADAGANTALEWSSSSASVATVNASGVVTGIAVGGPITITARSLTAPTITATASVSVTVASWTNAFAPAGLGTGGALTSLESQFLWNGGVNTAMLAAGFQGGNIAGSAGAQLLIRNGALSNVTPSGDETAYPGPVAGNGADDIMTWRTDGSTQTARRWNGSAFTALAWPNATPNFLYPLAVAAAGNGRYWAVGRNSSTGGGAPTVVATFDGTVWSATSNIFDETISTAIRPTGPTTAMLMMCKNNSGNISLQLYRIQGAIATPLTSPNVALNPDCRADLSGVTENDLIAATKQGVARWNGAQWSMLSAGLAAGEFPLATTQCGASRYALSNRGRVFDVQASALVPLSADGEAAAGGSFGLNSALSKPQIDCAPDGTLRVASAFGLLTRRTNSGWVDEHYAPAIDVVHVANPDRGFAAGA